MKNKWRQKSSSLNDMQSNTISIQIDNKFYMVMPKSTFQWKGQYENAALNTG